MPIRSLPAAATATPIFDPDLIVLAIVCQKARKAGEKPDLAGFPTSWLEQIASNGFAPVVAGMIRDEIASRSRAVAACPVVQDIPVLGALPESRDHAAIDFAVPTESAGVPSDRRWTTGDLGVKLGNGGNKNVFALKDYPGLVIALSKTPGSSSRSDIQDEFKTLRKLGAMGVPTVGCKAMVTIDGLPGLLLQRIPDAVGSKDYRSWVPICQRLNERSIRSLQAIHDAFAANGVSVDDMQLIIDGETGEMLVHDAAVIKPGISELDQKSLRSWIRTAETALVEREKGNPMYRRQP